jgi:cell division protein FtsB
MRHQTKSRKAKKKFWGSNIFTSVLVIILVFSIIKVSKEIMLRYEINQQINELETKLSDLESKTNKMDELIAYLKTDEYIEKEARLKLNLSKPGEHQINISGDKQIQEELVNNNDPNLIKWFNYFFE